MIIRDATIKDADQFKKLLVQLGYILTIEQVTQKIEIYLKRELYSIIVAEEDGIILGFIAIMHYDSFVLEYRCLYIESLIIDEKERSKGIGHRLIEETEKYALSNGCKLIELITLNRRKKDGTHDFYRSIGFQDHIQTDVTYFSKKIT